MKGSYSEVQSMRELLFVALCAFSGSLTIAHAQTAIDLTGRWRTVETSKGGIGVMYDFMQDGTARVSPGAILPMAYRLDGSSLTIDPDGPSFTLQWSGEDKVKLAVGENCCDDYNRIGTRIDAANPLFGEWGGERSMGGHVVSVRWIFRADASALMTIRFSTTEGHYEVRDGRLDATFGGESQFTGSLSFANGILSVDRGSGRITKLQRY